VGVTAPASVRVVHIITHPVGAAVLMRGQLAYLCARGFEVTVIASPGPELDVVRAREGVATVAVAMRRGLDAPWRDAAALARLTALLRRLRPAIVNASTPKAGLLGMLAARAAGVPIRIYTLRGLRLATARGVVRRMLGVSERMASAAATRVVCVSPSLRDEYVRGGYASAAKCTVLADGSSNGVDSARFARSPEQEARAAALRAELGIAPDAPVVGYVGRMARDKGVPELLAAFARVRLAHPAARLLLVGKGFAGDDDGRGADGVPSAGVVTVEHVAEPAPYYAMMSVLAFPSYREGFPNVPLEAAAAGIPVAGFASTGVVDAVATGVTGTLVPQGDVAGLAGALGRYLGDPALARAHGDAGRRRAAERFAAERLWAAWADEYRARLAELAHTP
jgi:glycosyltransferase involved in cell wall biosynthesis